MFNSPAFVIYFTLLGFSRTGHREINEKTRASPTVGSRFGPRSKRFEWFRVYRVGFTFSPAPRGAEQFLIRISSYPRIKMTCCLIVILCSKGFGTMDLSERAVVPRDTVMPLSMSAKPQERYHPPEGRPPVREAGGELRVMSTMGMFRSNKDEFPLCYGGTGWAEGPESGKI